MPERNNEYVYQPPAKFIEELHQRISNASFSDEFKQQIKSAQKEEGRKMFERLTRRIGDTVEFVDGKGYAKLNYSDTQRLLFNRLAAYEDTGLTPEEVKQLIVSDESKEQSSIEWFNRAKELQDELNSYKQAEADGRLVVLPKPEESDYEGLKVKYRVYKARNGEPVENCFVLRPDKDYAAIQALYAYAGSTDNVQLKEDIYRWLELIASEKEVGE